MPYNDIHDPEVSPAVLGRGSVPNWAEVPSPCREPVWFRVCIVGEPLRSHQTRSIDVAREISENLFSEYGERVSIVCSQGGFSVVFPADLFFRLEVS